MSRQAFMSSSEQERKYSLPHQVSLSFIDGERPSAMAGCAYSGTTGSLFTFCWLKVDAPSRAAAFKSLHMRSWLRYSESTGILGRTCPRCKMIGCGTRAIAAASRYDITFWGVFWTINLNYFIGLLLKLTCRWEWFPYIIETQLFHV